MPTHPRHALVDVLRGLTIVWVTLLHFHADTRGVPGREASPAAALEALDRCDLAEAAAVAVRSLIGLPGFRLDVLLFVTGLVLCLGRPVPPLEFYGRRARAILPSYWLGSLGVALLLLLCAGLRSWTRLTPLGDEIHHGTLLSRAYYQFEWLDLVRSASFVGRFETPRTLQVVAPSLWYLVLVAQLYLFFPWLRRLLDRVGPVAFVAVCAVVTIVGRIWVFRQPPLAAFDANATVIAFLPFRLFSAGAGMAAARWLPRLAPASTSSWWRAAALPAALGLVIASWVALDMNRPGTWAGILGPIVPLLVALPGLWVIAMAVVGAPALRAVLVWTGQRSLSLLVAQDFLRVIVGTALALGWRLGPMTFWLMPAYVAAALGLTAVWEPLQRTFGNRLWAVQRLATTAAPRP